MTSPSKPDSHAPTISVVAPCYNEEAVLPLFLEELFAVLGGMSHTFEIVLVDDGSTDRTFDVIREWCGRRPELRAVQFSRNFGHQAALTAGLDLSRGEAVITMDSDLQHPPALIPVMVDAWKAEAEVVLTKRRDQGRTPLVKRLTSAAFYRLLSRFSGIELSPGTSDFRLVDRRVVEAFADCRETHRMLRGLVQWVGFRHQTVPFEVGNRAAGESKYDLTRMLGLALDGIFSFSTTPLRAATLIGLVTSLLSAAYLIYVLFMHIFRPEVTTTGWASILGAVLLFGGVQLTFLGILGEYVGRTFQQVKERPLYVIRQTVPGETGRVVPPPQGRFRE